MSLGLGNSISQGSVIGFPDNHRVNFDGTDAYLRVGGDFVLHGGHDWALGLWWIFDTIHTASGYGNSLISSIEQGNAYGYGQLAFRANGRSYPRLKGDGTPNWALDPGADTGWTASAGVWYHSVYVFEHGVGLKVYVNGSLTDTYNFTDALDADYYNWDTIGAGGPTPVYTDYQMSEMAFWSGALLSADDISKIYNAGRGVDLKVASSYDTDRTSELSRWYRFGDGTLDSMPTLDGTNIVGVGLVADQVNPTLGSELWDTDAAAFTIGGTYPVDAENTHSRGDGAGTKGANTYSWVTSADTTISNDSNSLKVVSDGGSEGFANTYLRDNHDMSANVLANKIYRISMDVKIDSGTGTIQIYNNISDDFSSATTNYQFTNTSYQTLVLYARIANSASGQNYIQIKVPDGKTIHVDNMSIKNVLGSPAATLNMAADDFKVGGAGS